MYVSTHAREGEKTLACMSGCVREGCKGFRVRKSRRERGTKYDPSTLLGADAETAAWY